MSQALIRRDDSRLSIDFTPAALELKSKALEVSALIGKVNDASSQEAAVQAQQQLSEALALVEKARVACKQPVLDFGRLIDSKAREFATELKEEQLRIAKLVGDFQFLEQERVRRAQQAENERLAALEREKAAELAKAKSHEELDKIQEKFDTRATQEAPQKPIAPVRAAGQRVVEDFEIIVSDIHLLYRAHPNCVKMEALVGEIKSLLKAGVTVRGVIAKPIVKAGVTRGRPMAAIEV